MPVTGPYCVVWDCETTGLIQDARGKYREDKIKNLDISVLCAIKISSDFILTDPTRAVDEAENIVVWPHAADGAMARFLDLLDGADCISGYNCFQFDCLTLHRHYQAEGGGGTRRCRYHNYKTLDPFSRLRDCTTVWNKLDTLLQNNGLQSKTASGLEAIKMWAEGRLDELQQYCMADVVLTAKLMLLPSLKLSGDLVPVPEHVYGLKSAVHAHRMRVREEQDATAAKRPRDSDE
jgi:hypothetical protein